MTMQAVRSPASRSVGVSQRLAGVLIGLLALGSPALASEPLELSGQLEGHPVTCWIDLVDGSVKVSFREEEWSGVTERLSETMPLTCLLSPADVFGAASALEALGGADPQGRAQPLRFALDTEALLGAFYRGAELLGTVRRRPPSFFERARAFFSREEPTGSPVVDMALGEDPASGSARVEQAIKAVEAADSPRAFRYALSAVLEAFERERRDMLASLRTADAWCEAELTRLSERVGRMSDAAIDAAYIRILGESERRKRNARCAIWGDPSAAQLIGSRMKSYEREQEFLESVGVSAQVPRAAWIATGLLHVEQAWAQEQKLYRASDWRALDAFVEALSAPSLVEVGSMPATPSR